MPLMCREPWRHRQLSYWLAFLPHLVALGCGKQIGYVGSIDGAGGAAGGSAGGAAGGSAGGAAGGSAGGDVFLDEFSANSGQWEIETGLPNATVNFGRVNGQAGDGKVAELVFPGNTDASATDGVGPDYVTQISTPKRFHFGTLRSRVALAQCSGNESVVQSILGYFNDGTDSDKNGIVDDVEIDIQVPCEAKKFVLLSVFTDYQASARGTLFRKLSHIVDFSSGAEYDTPSDSLDTFVSSGNNPKLFRPALLGSNTFYELGFDWRPESIRFFVVDGNEEVTLWTLNDASHVPQLPVHLMLNLWHPSEHWYPLEGPADFPARDVTMLVDWVRFESM